MSNSAQAEAALDGVAIIGMAGRFPGARDVAALWRNVRAGVEGVTTFSDDALRVAGVPEAQIADPSYVKRWGAIDDADRFDAGFFGVSPRDAERMDPQHRLFLEHAWAALEHAGYAAGRRGQRIGVYGGVGFNHYLVRNLAPEIESGGAASYYRLLFGNDKDFVCTRVAHALDLDGPALTIQTACSTSLVAVCTAALHLLTHQCDLALAGGASVRVPLVAGYPYEEGGTSSPDGVCRTFDAAARGAVWGSGVGVVALKRLEEAVRDGDHVFAVIKGFALNNDGAQKAGFTAPSVDGQADVIGRALAMAGFDASSIGYVEAHGTATPLGDPIEVEALTQAFREAGARERGACALGSVKTNVGHLDVAAGVTGLIKAALAVEAGEIPPSLHFEQPNPHLDLASSPFFVNTELRPWAPAGAPRRAGVSAFGIGGTNAHVVLEEAPAAAPSSPPSPPGSCVLLPLSAKTEAALDRATRAVERWLEAHPDANLADAAHTLQVGREGFAHRRFVVSASAREARASLASAPASTAAARPSVALVGAAASPRALDAWRRLGVTGDAVAGPGALTVAIDPTGVDRRALLDALGRLWQAGAPIDWAALSAGERRSRVPLPTYPFERERHWIEPRREGRAGLHVVAWEPATPAPPSGRELLVVEDGGLRDALARDAEATLVRVWRARGDATATAAMALAELQLLLADGRPRDVVWVTERAQAVVAGDAPEPELSALWGLARSFAWEHTPVRLSLVDVDALPAPAALPSGGDGTWALRGGQVLAPRLARQAASGRWRAPAGDGAVLVTGGLGALGLRIAEHLVCRHGVRRLVLLGRRAPDGPRRERVAAIEAAGATVTIAEVDVTDREALARVLAAHPVRGVVHAAGVLDDGIVEHLTPGRLARVFAPKAGGARWLDELTRETGLDFFVLFSSVSALGAPGQASYAAANAYLDALAEERRARGLPAVSIGWGPWAGEGMAARAPAGKRVLRPIAHDEALALFDAALAQPHAVVYVADELPGPPRPPAGAPEAAPAPRQRDLRELVRTEAARLLGVDAASLPLDRSLAELGVDSLVGVELRSVLSTKLGRNVPGSMLLDLPSLDALAAALSDLLPAEARAARAAPRGITRLHPEPPFPPLYLVGGAVGGDELYLRSLANALGPSQPCYALHYPGMVESEQPLDDVTALADHFVAILRAFQPEGPCAIGGHSLGGMIAHEMAIKLSRAGRPVVELILLDAPLFTGESPAARARADLWRGSSLRDYVSRLRELGWLTPELERVLDGGSTAAWPLLERMWRANVTALMGYRPTGQYHGEVTFITPANDAQGLAACVDAWRATCPALKVARASGNHISMVQEPHVQRTAHIVRGLFGGSELLAYG
jgi:3-oxoacyl-(acyl-carrier-protein) synthase/thioesterase domain-containing protein/acyl carrier protein